MPCRTCLVKLAALALLLPAATTQAQAARVRYHYVPCEGSDGCTFRLEKPCAQVGEKLTWFGLVKQPYPCPPKPTGIVTFQHPATHHPVNVPLALPTDSSPNMEYRSNRVIYNYGSETVEVHFLSDGTFDVIYSSGLLRAP